jgi:hypothetical protein
MSVTAQLHEFDFWEFVDCGKCRLPFQNGAMPFWLTECGHVICNNHLSESVLLLPRFSQRLQMLTRAVQFVGLQVYSLSLCSMILTRYLAWSVTADADSTSQWHLGSELLHMHWTTLHSPSR